MTLRVLVTPPMMLAHINEYRELFADHGIEVEAASPSQALDEETLYEIIEDFDGAIAGDDPYTARVLRHARRLQVISKWGVGVDNIDLKSAKELGIHVTNTAGELADEVADVVVGYLVLLARRLHIMDQLVREGHWPKLQGVSLAGKAIGIVGLGHVGRAVGRRTTAMGMRVLGYDIAPAARQAAAEIGIQAVAWDDLLQRADFLSLNCSLTETNFHMIGEPELQAMKPGAYLINTARGALVDEGALVLALRNGRLGGAALDVFEEEPLPSDTPLRTFENCIFGSHNSSNTVEAVRRVNDLAIKNLVRHLKGVGSA